MWTQRRGALGTMTSRLPAPERLRQAVHTVRAAGIQAAALGRLTRDLPGFLSSTVSTADARDALRRRLETREQRLLDVVERGIYGNAGSPYLALLRHAGCEVGDFRALLAREGVEGALEALAARGVYVTYDELKGRRDAVRGSRRFRFGQAAFDNPLVRAHLVRFTGGSGGPPSRVLFSLDFVAGTIATVSVVLQAHGFTGTGMVYWYPAPVHWLVSVPRIGLRSVAWYYPVHPLPARMRILARYLALLGRLGGQRIPLPRRCDISESERLAGWLSRQLRSSGPLVLVTIPSAAARLGIAARSAGHDLRGLTIMLVGEPVTDARRGHIEASGARVNVNYSSVELTGVAYACAAPAASDDVHIMTDKYAVIQHSRAVGHGGSPVDALLTTGLQAAAGKIAFNLELGDYARLEVRDCACLLGSLGLRTHLSEIRSFEKLTGEGVTFARSNLQRILEEVLPARFGGTSLDYQLGEEEATDGTTRLVMRVSPMIGTCDEGALRACLLDELAAGSVVDQYQAGIWRDAGTVDVRREAPLATRAGKVLPFQPLRRRDSAGEPP